MVENCKKGGLTIKSSILLLKRGLTNYTIDINDLVTLLDPEAETISRDTLSFRLVVTLGYPNLRSN